MADKEFKIVRDVISEAQKKINQWRHDYDVEIVSVQADPEAPQCIIIALWRTKIGWIKK